MSRYIYSSTSSYWRGRSGYDSDEYDRHRDSTRRRRDRDRDRDHDWHRDPLGVMAEGLGKFVKKSFGVGDNRRSKKESVSAYGGQASGPRSDIPNRRYEDDRKDRARASRRISREYGIHDAGEYRRRSTDRISAPWPQYGDYHQQQYYWVDSQYGYPTAANSRTRSSTSHATWIPEPSRGYDQGYWRMPRGEPEYYTGKVRRHRERTQTPPLETDGRQAQSGSKRVHKARRASTASNLAQTPPLQAEGRHGQSGSKYRVYRVKNGATISSQTQTTPTTPKKVRFEGIYVHSDHSD